MAVRFVILFFSSIGNKVSLSFATIAVSFKSSRTVKASVSLLIVSMAATFTIGLPLALDRLFLGMTIGKSNFNTPFYPFSS